MSTRKAKGQHTTHTQRFLCFVVVDVRRVFVVYCSFSVLYVRLSFILFLLITNKQQNKQQSQKTPNIRNPKPQTSQKTKTKIATTAKAFGKSEPRTLSNTRSWQRLSFVCAFPCVSTRNNKNTKGGPLPVCSVSFCVCVCVCV